jgi:acyl dehydratase
VKTFDIIKSHGAKAAGAARSPPGNVTGIGRRLSKQGSDMRHIISLETLRAQVGQEIGVSNWIGVSQEKVDRFAEASGDRQWIHVDVERCKRESPFGGTVAHGLFTLSLLPVMLADTYALANVRLTLNYGFNKVRFIAPVPVGCRLRGRATLQSVDDIQNGAQIVVLISVEREGAGKPVCVAESVTRSYF